MRALALGLALASGGGREPQGASWTTRLMAQESVATPAANASDMEATATAARSVVGESIALTADPTLEASLALGSPPTTSSGAEAITTEHASADSGSVSDIDGTNTEVSTASGSVTQPQPHEPNALTSSPVVSTPVHSPEREDLASHVVMDAPAQSNITGNSSTEVSLTPGTAEPSTTHEVADRPGSNAPVEISLQPGEYSPSLIVPKLPMDTGVPETVAPDAKDPEEVVPSPTPIPSDLAPVSAPPVIDPQAPRPTEVAEEKSTAPVPETMPPAILPNLPSISPITTRPPDPPKTPPTAAPPPLISVETVGTALPPDAFNAEANLIPISTRQPDSGVTGATPPVGESSSSLAGSTAKDPGQVSTPNPTPPEGGTVDDTNSTVVPDATTPLKDWPTYENVLPPPPDHLLEADIPGSKSSREDPLTAVNKLTSSDANDIIGGDLSVALVVGLVAGCSIVIGVLLAVEIYVRRARRRHLEMCEAQRPIIVL